MISFKILLYLLAFRFICILSSIAHTLSVDFYDEHSRNVYIINIVTSFMNYILYCVCFILDVNECKFFNGGCHQVCVDKTLGFECRCLPGFELQSNKRDCKGIIRHHQDAYFFYWMLKIVFLRQKNILMPISVKDSPIITASLSTTQSCCW